MLGAAIMAGIDAEQEIASGAVSSAQRPELERLVARGLVAQRAMVEANLRLVVLFAAKWRRDNVPLEDLIQEGNIGLLRAVQRFDWRKGFKFSTYAAWWIRQALGKGEMRLTGTIYVPADVLALSRELKVIDGELADTPGSARVALTHYLERTGKSEKAVRVALETRRHLTSLDDARVDGRSVGELVGDGSPTLLERLVGGEDATELEDALAALSTSHRMVVTARYGLDGDDPRTQQAIGAELGFSPQKVRLLQAEAVEQLRHHLLGERGQ